LWRVSHLTGPSIAADTALAQAQQLAEQLEALAQAVEGEKGDTQVEANAQAIQALKARCHLNQDLLALRDQVATEGSPRRTWKT
jgi:hypothetical protein